MDGSASDPRPVSHLVAVLRQVPLFAAVPLDAVESLAGSLIPFKVSAGNPLIQQGEKGDTLYVVSSGRLEAIDEKTRRVLGEITTGEIVGETALLTDEPRGATVRAVVDTRGYSLNKDDFLCLMSAHPEEMRNIADLITRRATTLVREQFRPSQDEIVEFLRTVDLFSTLSDNVLGELAPHLQWFTLPRGETLLCQGEVGEQLYVVVSGRLRFDVHDAAGAIVRTGRIDRRDVVGELSILTSETRSATVTATRDCGLLTLTARTFTQLMNRYPAVVLGITRILATRLQSQSGSRPSQRSSTMAVIPVHGQLSVEAFVEPFSREISRSASVRTIGLSEAHRALGRGDGTEIGEAGFRAWLSRLEDETDSVVLCGVSGNDDWNDLCVRHADHALLLFDPREEPGLTRFELTRLGRIDSGGGLARELVFCRAGETDLPSERIAEFRRRRFHSRFHHVRDMNDGDIRRVARFVDGSAVGFALGGGGARGLAHIGAIRAIREVGIPIDLVVGTSIGALVGGAVAMEMDHGQMREATLRNLVSDRPFRDPAFPLVALLRGRRMSDGLRRFFGDRRIEELPVRFAAVATDLAARDLALLDEGVLWKAIRSSASLPALLPPVYDGGRFLVDGGLLDNAPGDVARELGVGTTVLFEVSGSHDHQSGTYADAFAGIPAGHAPGLRSYLRHRMATRRGRTSSSRRWPGIGEVLVNAMIVGSARHGRGAASRADFHLRLPVDNYTMLGFEAADELIRIGYESTIPMAREWAVSRSW